MRTESTPSSRKKFHIWRDPDPSIPLGLCGCGCGQKTTIPVKSNKGLGRVKGVPMRYVNGHFWHMRLKNIRYSVDPVTGCWDWVGEPNASGYGTQWDGEKNVPAHVYVYERVRGPIPEGLEPDHLCRNTMCVNPDHMEPVTHAVNTQRRPCVKLTMDLVRKIRSEYTPKRGERARLARIYNVSWTAINQIIKGELWKEVA